MPRRGVAITQTKAPRRGRIKARSHVRRSPSFNAGTIKTGTATNSGSVATAPTITVTGPQTPATIYFQNATQGKTIWVNQTVGSGHTLTIDFSARTVTLDSSVLSGVLTVDSRWWDLSPGANTINSNVAATVTWRAASTN